MLINLTRTLRIKKPKFQQYLQCFQLLFQKMYSNKKQYDSYPLTADVNVMG